MEPTGSVSGAYSTVLPTVHAIRCASVLEKAVERLQLMGLLSSTKTLKTQLDQAEGEGDGGVVGKILEDQKTLENIYEMLLSKKENKEKAKFTPLSLEQYGIHEVANKSVLEREQELSELRQVSSQLRDTTKKLCSTLKANPSDTDNSKKLQAERLFIQETLESCVRDLSDGIIRNLAGVSGNVGLGDVTFSSFFRAVSDRKMKKDKEEQTLSTDQEIFRILRQAQEDVARERDSRISQLQARSERLFQLKEEVRKLRMETELSFEKLTAETNAKAEANRRLEAETLKTLNEESLLLEKEMWIEERVYEELKRHLTESVRDLIRKIKEWTTTSKAHIDHLYDDLEKSRKLREQQVQDLEDCRERYQRAVEEKARYEEEDRKKAEEKRRQEEEFRLKTRAALLVQTAWRGFFRRNGVPKRRGKRGGKAGKRGGKAGASGRR